MRQSDKKKKESGQKILVYDGARGLLIMEAIVIIVGVSLIIFFLALLKEDIISSDDYPGCIVLLVVCALTVILFVWNMCLTISYHSSEVIIDANGIKRINHGKIKQTVLWSEIHVIYIITGRLKPNSNQIVIATKEIDGVCRTRLLPIENKSVCLRMLYKKHKEEVLRQFAADKIKYL